MSKPKSAKVDIAEGRYILTFKTVADIGTQTVTKFNSEEEEEKRQLIIVVEVPELSTKDKPFTLSRWITNSVGKKATGFEIMKACGLDPKKADWDDILDKSVEGIIEHTDSGNAKIKTFLPLKKGTKVPRGNMATSSVYLDENFDNDSFEAMPDFIQKQILKAPEFDDVPKPKAKAKAKANSKGKAKGKAKADENDEIIFQPLLKNRLPKKRLLKNVGK